MKDHPTRYGLCNHCGRKTGPRAPNRKTLIMIVGNRGHSIRKDYVEAHMKYCKPGQSTAW